MDYPQLPMNLKQAPYQELARAEMALRQYKNVTILGIKHWRAIPQLKDAIKQVNKDQRRVLKEIKARPEFHKIILPSPESRIIIERHIAARFQSQNSQVEKLNVSTPTNPVEALNIGDRVHSKFHNVDGEIIRIEWSPRVGIIYHVRLDDGTIVYCARVDLTRR